MLTTLSILSLDQGKIWREPATAASSQEGRVEHGQAGPARGWLDALRLPGLPAIAPRTGGDPDGLDSCRREARQAATRPPSTWSTCCWALTSSMPFTTATSRVSRSSAAS